jgi:hypothetical protein
MSSARRVCISGYTFCVKLFAWALIIAAAAGLAYALARWRRRSEELRRAAEERMSALLAETRLAAKPNADAAAAATQRLLFDAAAKAAEAGEPVLAIQLYARLLARYPESGLAAQARAAVEPQKKNLGKA